MKIIKTITDKDILGIEGMSDVKPRITARCILKNNHGKFAVMYSNKFNLYSLVGGGVEPGEEITEALKREVLEETGCSCDKISQLGIVEENRAHCNYTQLSYYYIVETNSLILNPNLTDSETENGTSVDWYSFEEMYKNIVTPLHTTNQRKFLQARDVAALNEYKKKLGSPERGAVSEAD